MCWRLGLFSKLWRLAKWHKASNRMENEFKAGRSFKCTKVGNSKQNCQPIGCLRWQHNAAAVTEHRTNASRTWHQTPITGLRLADVLVWLWNVWLKFQHKAVPQGPHIKATHCPIDVKSAWSFITKQRLQEIGLTTVKHVAKVSPRNSTSRKTHWVITLEKCLANVKCAIKVSPINNAYSTIK
jgi:hypothetical protein